MVEPAFTIQREELCKGPKEEPVRPAGQRGYSMGMECIGRRLESPEEARCY